MNTGGVVIDHVQQYGDSAGVTFVDEMLVHLACTISLVQCEVGSRVIAPAVVTVELLARHKLYRVNSQIFKVVELLECTVDVVCGAEISEMELVYDQIVLILYLKVLILPLESRFRSLESSHDTRGISRERRQIRIGGGRNPLVVTVVSDLRVRVIGSETLALGVD